MQVTDIDSMEPSIKFEKNERLEQYDLNAAAGNLQLKGASQSERAVAVGGG